MNTVVEYGKLELRVKEVMTQKNVSIYRLSKMTKLKYETVKKYYDNRVRQYDRGTLVKICYYLDCEIGDILIYKDGKR